MGSAQWLLTSGRRAGDTQVDCESLPCPSCWSATLAAAVMTAKGGCVVHCGTSVRLHAVDKVAAADLEQLHLLVPPGPVPSSQPPPLTSQRHGAQQAVNGG